MTSAHLAFAADGDGDAARAQNEVTTVDRESASVQAAINKAKSERYTVEQRLTNGELLYRTKDYPRAVVVFSEILEEFPDTASYPDALWLRGETFYAQKEYLSARRDYRALVDRYTEPRFNPYFGKALARLVDVSLRINDIKGLDEVFQKINQVPPSQVDAALLYAKGKGYYFKGDYSSSLGALQSVPNGNTYTHQARYFQGMVAIKQARPSTPPPPPANAPPDANVRVAPTNILVAATTWSAMVACALSRCAIIRRAPCLDWHCGRSVFSAASRRCHPRPIRLQPLPWQAARRHRRPDDD